MIRLLFFFALLFTGLYLNAEDDDCFKLSPGWKSEEEAITDIEKAEFLFSENVTSVNSKWMKSAHYYSCDNQKGYLIVRGKEIIFFHQDIPKSLWKDLKNSKSIGGFYNFYIKNKFKFTGKESEDPVL